MWKLSILLILVLMSIVIQGATFSRRLDPNTRFLPGSVGCLVSRRVNEVWQLPGGCERCRCLPDGETLCDTCGVTRRPFQFMCYQEQDVYPRCCTSLCLGDPGFVMSNYQRSRNPY